MDISPQKSESSHTSQDKPLMTNMLQGCRWDKILPDILLLYVSVDKIIINQATRPTKSNMALTINVWEM